MYRWKFCKIVHTIWALIYVRQHHKKFAIFPPLKHMLELLGERVLPYYFFSLFHRQVFKKFGPV
jgi:hypothetical protein